MPACNICPLCGSRQPEDGPSGLCPGCLLRLIPEPPHAVRSGDVVDPEPPSNGRSRGDLHRDPSGAGRPSRASGILTELDETVGPVPRVLLRDGPVEATRPVRPWSEEMPDRAG